MSDYLIKRGNKNDLDSIKPLWEKLNQLHQDLSPNFKSRFKNKTWESRKHDLTKKSKEILIDYVINNKNNKIIGYCISTIDREDDKIGEIDSIYIDELYRKSGLGKKLIEQSIQWLISQGTKTQKLLVGVGNEQVLDYYRQFNFYPLHIVMQRIDKK
ncbi:GNAT family N-acetyltransferase [Calditrichota bacterium]